MVYYIHYVRHNPDPDIHWAIISYIGEVQKTDYASEVLIDVRSCTYEDKKSNSNTRFYIKAKGTLTWKGKRGIISND